MTTLNEKSRDAVKSLLEDHQKVTDALHYGPQSKYHASMVVMTDDGGYESYEVDFLWANARSALIVQRDWVEAELAKHGVTLDIPKR